jgi:hypothetical protein
MAAHNVGPVGVTSSEVARATKVLTGARLDKQFFTTDP